MQTVGSGRNPAAMNLPELAGIGENCAGIEKSCTGTDSGFNGSSRRNDRPGLIAIRLGSKIIKLAESCQTLIPLIK
ncbi:unnamed protein product [Adineta ricciae]|uniref:Uncharacterized protein n=1 Tax=Adineta ricciae TaxID=249248 RepID=A0A816FYP3_ADIRI|nr:unnamed protein product [Adineta ricciae]